MGLMGSIGCNGVYRGSGRGLGGYWGMWGAKRALGGNGGVMGSIGAVGGANGVYRV